MMFKWILCNGLTKCRCQMVRINHGFLNSIRHSFLSFSLSLRATSDDTDIRVLAEQLEVELRRTKGVASVTVSGQLVEEVQITLDREKT